MGYEDAAWIEDKYHQWESMTWGDRRDFRERSVGYIGTLLDKIERLRSENKKLKDDKRPREYFEPEHPESCYCAATPKPPCSWCTREPDSEEAKSTQEKP